MNHNYADWELTQLLPDRNTVFEYKMGIMSIHKYGEDEPYFHLSNRILKNYGTINSVRVAWTWEDIRLYLESKDIFYNIERIAFADTTKYMEETISFARYQAKIMVYPKKDRYYDMTLPGSFRYCNTYEEARIEGIKWCLKLIELNEQS